MNKVILTGRVTQDLELRNTGKVDVVNYQLAVKRDKDNTDFINITTFGEFAKTLCEYIKKGDMLGIEGNLHITSYEKDGKKQTSYSVVTDRIEFLQTKREDKKVEKTSIEQDEITLTDADLPF